MLKLLPESFEYYGMIIYSKAIKKNLRLFRLVNCKKCFIETLNSLIFFQEYISDFDFVCQMNKDVNYLCTS